MSSVVDKVQIDTSRDWSQGFLVVVFVSAIPFGICGFLRNKRYEGLYSFGNLGTKMDEIKVYVSDELERKFREAAMKLYGYDEGSLSTASEKAFTAWLSQVSEVMDLAETIEDPVEAIYGMLSHVSRTGVDLQHEARDIRAKRSLEYRDAT
jgi:hypothetical protein